MTDFTEDNAAWTDRVSLREFELATEIGAFSEERGIAQRLVFNVVVDVAPVAGPLADDVDRVMSYDLIVEAVEAEAAAARVDLLETLAEGIAGRLLAHPRAQALTVRVEKLDRVAGRIGVEIRRGRRTTGVATRDGAAPRVYCLARGVRTADWLAGWAAGLPEGPVVLAVEGSPVLPRDAEAARRVRFLAAEEAAWALRGMLGADVIGSRAELAHAFKTGRRALWAPSRMLFSAKALPDGALDDFAVAVAWFAAQMRASALIFVGRPAPAVRAYDGPVSAEHASG